MKQMTDKLLALKKQLEELKAQHADETEAL